MMPPQAPKRVTTAVVKDKGAVVGYGLWWRAWRRAWKVRMRGEHRVVADGSMHMHVLAVAAMVGGCSGVISGCTGGGCARTYLYSAVFCTTAIFEPIHFC